MTADDVRKRLAEACKRVGGQRAFAKLHDIDPGYVNCVLHSRKEPHDKICKALKIKRVITYIAKDHKP